MYRSISLQCYIQYVLSLTNTHTHTHARTTSCKDEAGTTKQSETLCFFLKHKVKAFTQFRRHFKVSRLEGGKQQV